MAMKSEVAIITAAGQGIGAACATELASKGYSVVLMSRSGSARKLAEKLGGKGMDGSVTDVADLQKLVDLAMSSHGRIDVVVNNTGHVPQSFGSSLPFDPELDAPILEIPDSDWHAGLEIALLNVVRMARIVTPLLLQNGGGSIVNISTFAALEPRMSFPISSSIRLALAGFTKIFTDKYAKGGIRMNNVLPGFMENWPMDEKIAKTIPMMRPGRFTEIAKAVAFLASNDASYVTGQNMLVDGGINRHI